jgi:hypothetical protein
MASNPGTTATQPARTAAAKIDPVQNETATAETPKAPETSDSDIQDQQAAYSAPGPEELAKKFKAWE